MKKIFFCILLVPTFFSCQVNVENANEKIIYFPDSKVIKQSVEMKDGKKEGVLRTYYRSGSPEAIQHYHNDLLMDTSYFFHENGILASFQIVEAGINQGCWKKFNPEGKEYWSACFKYGKLDGPSSELSYKSLVPLTRLNFKQGLKQGKQETFYANGKPESVTFFQEGIPCPGTEEWTSTGKKINNDFKTTITKEKKKNELTFYMILENARPDDEVYQIIPDNNEKVYTTTQHLIKTGDRYKMDYDLSEHKMLLSEIHLAAFRKTAMGNTYVKKIILNTGL